MLRIRLRRVGKKKHPSYRIVVAESSAPRDGAYVEWIGNYDPMADPPLVSLKADRAVAWLNQGAQPSDAVQRILDWNGIRERTPLQRKVRGASEDEASAPAPSAVAAAEPPPAEASQDEPTGEAPADEPAAEASQDEPTGEAPAGEPAEEASDDDTDGEATSE